MSSVIEDVKNEVFTYTNLVHAVSGMTGGVCAISTFYPLNIIRMRLQIDEGLKAESVLAVGKKIADRDGLMALYQGWWSAVVSLGASNFVYFYVYNAFKTIYRKLIAKSDNVVIDPITNLAIASLAGVVNVLSTTPLWVAGTRLSVQSTKQLKSKTANSADGAAPAAAAQGPKPYTGVYDCLTRIVQEEGVASLWKGVGPSLILVSNPTIQFSVYERLKIILEKRRGDANFTPTQFFVMGAIAKAVATVFTYPLQIAQSRLRADRGKNEDPSTRNYKGTLDVLAKIAKDAGPLGWFKGMEAKLWQTVLTAAFQFQVFEMLNKFLHKLLLPDHAGAGAGAGAGSGSFFNKKN